MPVLSTEAVVLHSFDYSESSRILRLATRDAGTQSVLARGARRASTKFGSALGLFAQGVAHLYLKGGRDLQTMSSFDCTHARTSIGCDLERFTGAAALAELMLRFSTDEHNEDLYMTLVHALDAIEVAAPEHARGTSLAGAWRLVAELGFAPALDICGICETSFAPGQSLRFVPEAGGVLCARCGRDYASGRAIPDSVCATISAWLQGSEVPVPDIREARAHQRLLREFVHSHLADGRSLRAFEVWENGDWNAR
ncbi:MAG: DNA repair protein RecO [Anaerolineae bacterium]|nr:DNA repair protein RecO [Gemmatimonadaceae bacterium]